MAFLLRYWRYAVMGILALALAFTWHSRNSWKDEAGQWHSAYDAQKSAYIAVQAAARAKAEAQKVKDESRYQALAERADNAEQEISEIRAAAERYARANSVHARAKASHGAAGGAGSSGAGGAAASGNGPGDDASVVVERADFDVLVENTIKLKQVHDWGNDLLAEGLAVKGE